MRQPAHTATQFALLTALAAVGRTTLASGAGFIAEETGWVWFFAITAIAAVPSLLLLGWLQGRGHFTGLGEDSTPQNAVRCLIAADSVPSSR